MPRAGLSRERVVEAAAALADDLGLSRLTLAAVASHFGVAIPSLYKHVGGIDALRRDLALLGLRELTAEVGRAVAGKAQGEALTAMAVAYRQYATRRPGPYEATLRAPAPDDSEHVAVAGELLHLVGAVIAGYGITGDDATDAIRSLRAALHGFVALEAAGGMKMARDTELSYHRLVGALDLAFRAWPSTLPVTAAAPAPQPATRTPGRP